MAGLREILEAFQGRVWAGADGAAIAALMRADAEIDGLEPEALVGRDAYAALHRLLTAQFADIRVELGRTVEEGEWIAGDSVIVARHRATGCEVAARSLLMVRIVGGRIAAIRNQIDYMSLFEQAGLLPPRTLDFCLLGRRPKF